MKKRTLSIRAGIFYLLFTAVVISVLIPNSLWLLATIKEYKKDISAIEKEVTAHQKERVIEELGDVLHYIHFMRQQEQDVSPVELQSKILDYLATYRFGNGGYIFINQYDGRALLFNGERVKDYKDVSNMTDAGGLRVFDLELELAHTLNGGFMQYQFKKMNSDKPLPKLSYVQGVPDWQWIVGAGEYLDDASQRIHAKRAIMVASMKGTVLKTALLLLLFTLMLITISSLLSLRLSKQFSLFLDFFKSSMSKDKQLKVSSLFITELQEIGAQANAMVQEQKKLRNELFSAQENLKNRTTLLQSVLQSAPAVAILATDLDFEIIFANSFAGELFDLAMENLTNKAISQLDLHEKVNKTFLQNVADHLVENDKFCTTLERATREGRTFIEVTITGIYDVNGDVTGYLFFCSDITEKKRVDQELLKHRQHLEQLVMQRTAELENLNKELQKKNDDLEHFNDLFVGREFRIKELRDELKTLQQKLDLRGSKIT